MMDVKHYLADEMIGRDPYEETVDGTRNGEMVTVELDSGLTLTIQEVKSGVGDYFEVHAQYKGKQSKAIGFGFHDDFDEDGMYP